MFNAKESKKKEYVLEKIGSLSKKDYNERFVYKYYKEDPTKYSRH